MTRPPPVFEELWHAQVFALTVHLNESGLFDWPAWAARFGAKLAEYGVDRDLNGGDDYFTAWLAALEDMLADLSVARPADVETARAAWEAAYLSTPHGAPVRLDHSSISSTSA